LEGKEIENCPLTPAHLAELAALVKSGTVSSSLAKATLEEAFHSGKAPREIVSERGYVQVSDAGIIGEAVRQALDANPAAVADYLAGKETASKYLTGQVMKISKGKANPSLVGEMLAEQLQAMRSV
jgi:aspartyl-tRNA(Asn)/glutamyl-tRNA(Gln) amidotransferase subunit B